MCGIELSSETVKNISKNPHSQFSSVDIIQFFPIVKYPAVLDYYSGKHLMKKARVFSFVSNHGCLSAIDIDQGQETKDLIQKTQFFSQACQKMQSCESSFPSKKNR